MDKSIGMSLTQKILFEVEWWEELNVSKNLRSTKNPKIEMEVENKESKSK